MVSPERLEQLSDVAPEDPSAASSGRPAGSWEHTGELTFHNLTYRYHPYDSGWAVHR